MQQTPLYDTNLSQHIFETNENIAKTTSNLQKELNYSNVSQWNSLPGQNDFDINIFNAYMNQANVSTYYQSNPFPILTNSEKYTHNIMGGEIKPYQKSGYWPENTYSNWVNFQKKM